MKCTRCNGNGRYKNIFGDMVRCDFCYGTGEITYGEDDRIVPIGKQKPQTNEEWLRTCSTEELAEFIRKQRDDWSDGWYSDWHPFSEIVEWLKEEHNA